MLKFEDKDDIRISIEDRDDMVSFIINRFANKCPDLNLKIYSIPKADLTLYCIYNKAVIKA